MLADINYRPKIIEELITNERLKSYTTVFKHSNDAELIGAYLWNIHVSSAIYPLLTISEVTLRNSIDSVLTKNLGTFWWSHNRLHYRSFDKNTEAPSAITKLKNKFATATNQVRREKQKRYNIKNATPTHHEIIAKTDFATWEFLLDKEFMGPDLIWPKHMGAVFQGNWPSSKTAKVLLTAKDLVRTTRELRNRVSHHEPVWKRFGVHTEADAIEHLNEKIDTIMKLIALVSPDKEQLIFRKNLLSQAKQTCSIEALRQCQRA